MSEPTPPSITPTTASQPLTAPVQPAEPQVPLDALVEAATPLLELWINSTQKSHEREVGFRDRQLEAEGRQLRLITLALTVVACAILLLAGFLIIRGSYGEARDLVQYIVSIGGAAFGAWGIAASRRHKGRDE